MSELRMTLQTRLILHAFLNARIASASGEMFGAQLCRETDLGPGTVHAIITRLLEAGWLTDRWEEDGDVLDRPRRRYYRLTGDGAAQASEAVARADTRRRFVFRGVGSPLPDNG
jgi:PadR family transcriptional regulator PadR